MGARLLSKLRKIRKDRPLIGDVRGIGLMVGVELVRDAATLERASRETHEVVQRAFRKGLLLLPCGENVVRFCPPLVVSAREVDTAVEIFTEALDEFSAEVRSK
jgi:4-aminobutyrate aminotransferase